MGEVRTAEPRAGSGRKATTTDRLFRIAIAIKGLDGALQLVAGLVLAMVPATVVTDLAHQLIARDVVSDLSDSLAGHLQNAVTQFADDNTRWFAIVYLLLHGVIKLVLVAALWHEIMPAYPIATVLLGAFVVYELVRGVNTHSVVLPIFAAIDIVIIVLVIREYQQLRREHAVGGSSSTADPGSGGS
jgi:uncharacterized membrane protein